MPLTPRVVSDAVRNASKRENTRAGTLQYDIVPYIPRLIRRIRGKTCAGTAGVCRSTVDKEF